MNTNSVYPTATVSGLHDGPENSSPCGFPLCNAIIEEPGLKLLAG